ncbi:cytokinesis protein Cyk3 [Cordyceps militaris CM01]|uniref:Cytokinesis protein Cyk3 n=1 Tax=Cordyceps militaris (strain CM01) TaxID=983644 RepID=G3JGG7_CORMM|nr:cytokinesis protein Cyk3 [Cordyceps militaris CM01]EGX92384.1 cytokinesis protein Cyk3 [Cordyceps militaris CM01]
MDGVMEQLDELEGLSRSGESPGAEIDPWAPESFGLESRAPRAYEPELGRPRTSMGIAQSDEGYETWSGESSQGDGHKRTRQEETSELPQLSNYVQRMEKRFQKMHQHSNTGDRTVPERALKSQKSAYDMRDKDVIGRTPMSQAVYEDPSAGLGGLVQPKAPKRNIFKKIFESAKTGVANNRGNLAGGLGHEPGPIDWVQVRRDINRSNSLSKIERAERRDRCQIQDHAALNPVDELYESIEGDEAADGNPVLDSLNYQSINLTQVDKNSRFINEASPMTTAISLATTYVCRPYRSDVQRLRAIFTWVSEKIVWEEDFEGEINTREVIQSRRGCAEEYAVLVMEMCLAVGITCEVVRGYLKIPGEIADSSIAPRPNHWWNAVLVDNEWRMMDCCLASPSNPKRSRYSTLSSNVAEPWWFLTRPSELCWTHVPEHHEQQHIVPAVAHEILLNLPCVCPTFFKDGVEMVDFNTSSTRIEDLEMVHLKMNVPSDIELVAEVETRAYSQDHDGDVFESGEVVKTKALVQAEWYGGVKRYTIKALLPGDEGQGVLKRNDIYIVQPQCQRLALNNTFVFAIRQHPCLSAAEFQSNLTPSSNPGRTSPNPFARPSSSMSMAASSVNGSNPSSASGTVAGHKPAKLAIQTPGGKILRLMRKEDRKGITVTGRDDDEMSDGGTWETIIKCSETGIWRGLVLADRTARCCGVWAGLPQIIMSLGYYEVPREKEGMEIDHARGTKAAGALPPGQGYPGQGDVYSGGGGGAPGHQAGYAYQQQQPPPPQQQQYHGQHHQMPQQHQHQFAQQNGSHPNTNGLYANGMGQAQFHQQQHQQPQHNHHQFQQQQHYQQQQQHAAQMQQFGTGVGGAMGAGVYHGGFQQGFSQHQQAQQHQQVQQHQQAQQHHDVRQFPPSNDVWRQSQSPSVQHAMTPTQMQATVMQQQRSQQQHFQQLQQMHAQQQSPQLYNSSLSSPQVQAQSRPSPRPRQPSIPAQHIHEYQRRISQSPIPQQPSPIPRQMTPRQAPSTPLAHHQAHPAHAQTQMQHQHQQQQYHQPQPQQPVTQDSGLDEVQIEQQLQKPIPQLKEEPKPEPPKPKPRKETKVEPPKPWLKSSPKPPPPKSPSVARSPSITKRSPAPQHKLRPVNTGPIMAAVAEECIGKARSQAHDVAMCLDPDDVTEYHRLISTGLSCFEGMLQTTRLTPREEARIRLRYATVLHEETENIMEAETALTKGIALCDKHRMMDLKYCMQYSMLKLLFQRNHKAALKAVDGHISNCEGFKHVPWYYAFRLLKATFYMEMGNASEASALENIRAIQNVASTRGDNALSIFASVLEGLALLKTAREGSIEKVQSCIAQAAKFQFDPTIRITQLDMLVLLLDFAASLHHQNPDATSVKLRELQRKIDDCENWNNVKADFMVPIKKQAASSNIVGQDTASIVDPGDGTTESDNLVITFMTKIELRSLIFMFSGLSSLHKQSSKSTEFWLEGSKILETWDESTLGIPYGPPVSLHTAIKQRQWRTEGQAYMAVMLGLLEATHCQWATVKGYMDKLEGLLSDESQPTLKLLALYLSGVYHQGLGELQTALDIFQRDRFTEPLTKSYGLKVGEQEVSMLAGLNRLWIMQHDSCRDDEETIDLIEQLQPLCNTHWNIDLRTAWHNVMAALVTDPPQQLNQQKQHIQAAMSGSKVTANIISAAVTLCIMRSRFFENVIGDQALKSARAAAKQAQRSGNVLWQSVADGMLAHSYDVQGQRDESRLEWEKATTEARNAFKRS